MMSLKPRVFRVLAWLRERPDELWWVAALAVARRDDPGACDLLPATFARLLRPEAMPDPSARQAVVESLTDLGAADRLDLLALALRDPDPGVRRSAAEALGWQAGCQAVELLIGAIQDEDYSVRSRVIWGLPDMVEGLAEDQVAAVVDALVSALGDEARTLR